jgi:formylglycine-generating enzyme required for sulfatase activity
VIRGLKQPGRRLLTALCLSALPTPAAPQAVEAHKPGEVFRDCPDCEELVVVPSGDFVMGSNDNPAEAPPHHVVIAQPFAVGRREVTFAEWDLCVAADVCKYTPSDHGWGRGERPVIDVSWEDTKPFITWLSQKSGQTYRLLTEAEWEYASRAGTVSSYWWGKDVGAAKAKCLECGGDPAKQTVPTGSFRPNGFGLFDTSGNAAEWVQDCWNASYRGAPQDGSAWNTGDCGLHVLRGGSFANKANAVRSASRFRYDFDVRYYANGFRVARDLK